MTNTALATPLAPPSAGRPLGRGRLMAAGAIFAVFAVLPFLFEALGEPFLVVLATRVLIFAIAALSLDLILGYGALVSFGHAAFVGIGAYAVAILASHGIEEILVQFAVALAVSGLFALVTGAISLRTKGVYFIMITLAFGQMAFFFMVSLSAYGGDDGMTLARRSALLGTGILESRVALFYLAFACLLALFILANALVGSRFGRVIRGTRDNAVRMQAIGFSPFRYQLTAYVVSGMMAAVAGVLLANQAEFVSPAYMSWGRSGELIAIVALGGIGTLIGPILGAAAFIALEDSLAAISHHWRLGFGVLLVLVVLFTRGGIYGFLARLFARRA